MPRHLFGLAAFIPALLLAAACSNNDASSDSTGPKQRYDTSDAPDIAPSAAPGVAFNYDYAFNLPDWRISATQEAHASACEKLGLARCRITGMSYSVDDDRRVNAELDLKLDPTIARQFGKSAQRIVESSDGKLIRLEIGSSDEGEKIALATREKTSASSQVAQLKEALARTKPGTDAYARLVTQLQALQQQAAEQSAAIQDSQTILASTPLKFHYYGEGGVPGFRGNPLFEAWRTFVSMMVTIVGLLLQALAILVPLGLLVALLVAMWRTRLMRRMRRWFNGPERTAGYAGQPDSTNSDSGEP